jgi:hypothetical protein
MTTKTSRGGNSRFGTKRLRAAPGPNLRNGKTGRDTNALPAVADSTSRGSKDRYDTKPTPVASGPNLRNGNVASDTKSQVAVADPASRGSNSSAVIKGAGAASGPILADHYLWMASKALDELEATRKANENRLRQLQDPDTFALPADNPRVVAYAELVKSIKAVEDSTIKELEKTMRAHPFGEFQADLIGVGAKQLARLLAAIRDPYWNDNAGASRTFGQLKAYCGLDVRNGEAPRLKRGQQCNWNSDAKMRLWNIAAKTIMFDGALDKNGKPRPRSPYRDVYDAAKEKYADTTHPTSCARCGPKGKPAQPGSLRSAGHQHACSIRLVMVAILRDLYDEAVRLHQTSTTSNVVSKSKCIGGVVEPASRSSRRLTVVTVEDRDQAASRRMSKSNHEHGAASSTSRSSISTSKSKAANDDRDQTSTTPSNSAKSKPESGVVDPASRSSIGHHEIQAGCR